MELNSLVQAISRQIRGISSAEDDAVIEQWLSADQGNKAVYAAIADEQQQLEAANRMKQIDTAAALKRVYRKAETAPQRFWLYTKQSAKWAVAAASIVAVVVYVANTPRTKTQTAATLEATADKMPAKKKAILLTGSGNEVVLQENGDTTFVQHGIKINQHGGLLSYTVSDNTDIIQIHQLITPKAAKFSMMLPDGSKVWLNAASSLKYPSRFTGPERLVELEGEGFFEINKNADQPFTVLVNGATKIQVLGTEFNVRAYNSSKVETTLIGGAVKVSVHDVSKLLMPGELAIAEDRQIKLKKGDIASAIGWRDDKFVFHDLPVSEVMAELSRWYDVAVVFDNNFGEAGTLYNGEISRDVTLKKLTELLEKTGIAKFRLTDGTLHVLPYREH